MEKCFRCVPFACGHGLAPQYRDLSIIDLSVYLLLVVSNHESNHESNASKVKIIESNRIESNRIESNRIESDESSQSSQSNRIESDGVSRIFRIQKDRATCMVGGRLQVHPFAATK
jgi:hypothetical protein